ncbi:MAG: 2-oxo-4-hydroxy-4-carboxy-5-ureidoimidazoline decarboxylase [Micromonosporaceae bacterium]|nr:2-oxo-4-hydroxy-4-carboxy-5-ureidoimidazoline decarboxylase [Micromonosporaceae bacterium]
MPGLDRFNALPADQARRELVACCAAQRFAEAVAEARPYPHEEALRETADKALADLDWADVSQALAAHPRIGERATGDGREASWSAAEQSAAAAGDADVRQQIIAGNVAYEQRFGHVFLICAAGRPAEEILADLTARLDHDPAEERQVVREELRKIVYLRLEKVLSA